MAPTKAATRRQQKRAMALSTGASSTCVKNKAAIPTAGALATQTRRFLSLPPELRNAIYEYALLGPSSIEVNPDFKIPGPLVACQQVRNEALGIYYKLNTFSIVVEDCDATLLNLWTQHCCKIGQLEYDLAILVDGDANWDNLVKWVKAIWAGDGSRRLLEVEGMSELEQSICAAHDIGYELTHSKWQGCEDALWDLLIRIGGKDDSWLHTASGFFDYMDGDADYKPSH
ncbi:hypothetical protein LTR85_011712 [Meristemomyces frigidus]|nr:hypothetical protein LTR85_011712 [Meristemomyces frigidus]